MKNFTDEQIDKLSDWLDVESAISRAYHKRDYTKLNHKICTIYNRHLDKLYFMWFFLTADTLNDSFKELQKFIEETRSDAK